MRRRIVATVLAVILAAVGASVLVLYVRGAEERAMAGVEAVDVLVVQESVEEGTPAEDLDGRVGSEKVAAKLRADSAVSDMDALEGRVAAVDLVPGEQLLEDRFVEPASFEAAGEVDVPEGLQVVTVSLSAERTVGGQLSPGDTVGVAATFGGGTGGDGEEGGTGDGPTTHLMLNKVLVTNVQGASSSQRGEEGEEDSNAAPDGSLLVSLAVEAGQAEKVVFTAENGSLWLTSQPEDATNDGSRIQTLEEIYQ